MCPFQAKRPQNEQDLLAASHRNQRDIVKKPGYSEPMIGWNEDDFHAGVTKFGVSHYEGTAKLKITTPTCPALLPPPPSNEPEADEVAGLLM